MGNTTAYWHKNGAWIQGTPEEYFPLNGRVISLVGGGGKTSLMYHLARASQDRGYRTVAMTTTRIYRPDAVCSTLAQCQARWDAGQFAVCGQAAAGEKLAAPAPELLEQLLVRADTVLVEADGARGMACKAPAQHEPVLLPQSDVVIGVMGLDVLDRPIGEACFRPELVCDLLGCSPEHRLTEEDMVQILLSPQGTRKSVGQREYHILLNKCDDAQRLARGKTIAARLENRGHTKTVLSRLL